MMTLTGIGYHVGKEIIKKLESATCYLTSRDATMNFSGENCSFILASPSSSIISGHEILIGMELGTAARHRAKFLTLDVRDVPQIGSLRKSLMDKHAGIDILVNNAAVYYQPTEDQTQFVNQTKTILETNYWGTRNLGRFVTNLLEDFTNNCSQCLHAPLQSQLSHCEHYIQHGSPLCGILSGGDCPEEKLGRKVQ